MDQQELVSPPKKRPARHFSVDDKKLILNIFKFSTEQNPANNKTENITFTANAAGVSVSSVHNILREYKEAQALQQPKVYSRKRAILDNINNETKCKIRRLVHSFSKRNEPLTLDKILVAVHKDKELTFFKRTTLRLLLAEMGFRYCKKTRNFLLKEMEQEQVVNSELNIKDKMEEELEEHDQRLVDDAVDIKEEFQMNNKKLLKREQVVASALNSKEEMQDSLQSFDEHGEKSIAFETVYIKEEFIADSEDHECYMKHKKYEQASNNVQDTVSMSNYGDDDQASL